VFTRAKEAVTTAVEVYKVNRANRREEFHRNLSAKSRTAACASDTSSSVFRDNLNLLASVDLNSKSLSSAELQVLENTLKPVIESLSSLCVEKTDDLQLFKNNPKAIQNLVLIASEYPMNPEVKDQASKLLAAIIRNSLSPRAFSSNADKGNLEKFLKVIEASDKVEKYSAAVDFLSSLNGQRGGLTENLGKFYSTLEKGLDAGLGAVLSEPLQKGLIAQEISTILNDPMEFIETLKQSSTVLNTDENRLVHKILDLAASNFGVVADSNSGLDPKWQELFKNVISAKTDTQVKLAVGNVGQQMLETVNALSHHDSEVQSAENLLSLVKVNLGLYPDDSQKRAFLVQAFSNIEGSLSKFLHNSPMNSSVEERLEFYLALQKRTLEQEQRDFNRNFVALSEILNKLSMPMVQEDGQIINSSGFGGILKQRLSDLYDGEMVFTKIVEDLGENDFEINAKNESPSKTAQALQLQQLVSSLQARQDILNGDHNKDSMYFNFALAAISDNRLEYERISSHNIYAAELLKHKDSIPDTKRELQAILNTQDSSNPCVQELNRYLVADQNSLLFKQILENKQELKTLGIYSDLERLVIKKVKLEQDLDLLFFKTMAAEREHRLSTGTKSEDIDLTNLMPSHGFDMEKYPLLKDSSIFKDQNALNSLIEAKEEKSQVINNLIDVTVKSFTRDGSSFSSENANALAERFTEMLGVVKDSLFNEPNDRAAHNFRVNLKEYHSANINNTVLDQAPALAQRFLIQIMRFIENLLVDPQLAVANQGE
jgi:hypothetical protein